MVNYHNLCMLKIPFSLFFSLDRQFSRIWSSKLAIFTPRHYEDISSWSSGLYHRSQEFSVNLRAIHFKIKYTTVIMKEKCYF